MELNQPNDLSAAGEKCDRASRRGPGGLTTAEAMALGKPPFILNPIPGQETVNSDVLVERGAAEDKATANASRHIVNGRSACSRGSRR